MADIKDLIARARIVALVEGRMTEESGPEYGMASEMTRARIRSRNRMLMDLADAIAALKIESAPDPRDAEIAALRDALAPFAAMADHYQNRELDDTILSASPARGKWIHIRAGDLSRAAALAKGGQR